MKKHYEILVKNLIPDWIKVNYPKYVAFVSYIFEEMEQENGVLYVLENFYKFIDVSYIDENTLEQYLYQYANSFPIELAEKIEISVFVKNAKTFYSSKGSKDSFRFIFNLLNGTLNIYYPGEDVFIIDDVNSTLSGLLDTTENRKKKVKRIHDNKYYAFYVYEIQTDLDFTMYYDIIKKIVHPAGTKLFIKRLVLLDTDTDTIIYPVPEIVWKSIDLTWFSLIIRKPGILDDIMSLQSEEGYFGFYLSGTNDIILIPSEYVIIRFQKENLAGEGVIYLEKNSIEELQNYTLNELRGETVNNLITENDMILYSIFPWQYGTEIIIGT